MNDEKKSDKQDNQMSMSDYTDEEEPLDKTQEYMDVEYTEVVDGEVKNMEDSNVKEIDEEKTVDSSKEEAETAEGEDDNNSKDHLNVNVKELQKEKEELTNLLQRVKADFDNYRKRMMTDKENVRSFALFDFVCRLLPVLDNMDRALESAKSDDVPESFVQGLEMIKKQVEQAMEGEGVCCIESKGACFDPRYHEAVMQTDEGDFEPNTVVEEFQKGYILKERVLRPAMVKVFMGDDKASMKEDTEEEDTEKDEL